MYSVQNLFDQHGASLKLELIVGTKGLSRRIRKPEVQRPGLGLTGFLKNFSPARVWIFGRHEFDYLRSLEGELRKERLAALLTSATTAVLIAKGCGVSRELTALCEEKQIPLFRSRCNPNFLLNRLSYLLMEEFCPTTCVHGSLVEVFGIGVLIQGESSIGKSEAALGLIEKGHRLISDDLVRVKKTEGSFLIGRGPEITSHLMEIRGIGLLNIAHLYGAVCVRPDKSIDMIVQMEEWNDQHFYDRVGLDERFTELLGVNVPHHILPVKPGRDVVLLLETLALNHRLKQMGYHSAKEFNAKLLDVMNRRKRRVSAK